MIGTRCFQFHTQAMIGLTDLQKSEGAMATLAPPSSDGHAVVVLLFCYGLAAANKDSNIVLGLTF